MLLSRIVLIVPTGNCGNDALARLPRQWPDRRRKPRWSRRRRSRRPGLRRRRPAVRAQRGVVHVRRRRHHGGVGARRQADLGADGLVIDVVTLRRRSIWKRSLWSFPSQHWWLTRCRRSSTSPPLMADVLMTRWSSFRSATMNRPCRLTTAFGSRARTSQSMDTPTTRSGRGDLFSRNVRVVGERSALPAAMKPAGRRRERRTAVLGREGSSLFRSEYALPHQFPRTNSALRTSEFMRWFPHIRDLRLKSAAARGHAGP